MTWEHDWKFSPQAPILGLVTSTRTSPSANASSVFSLWSSESAPQTRQFRHTCGIAGAVHKLARILGQVVELVLRRRDNVFRLRAVAPQRDVAFALAGEPRVGDEDVAL